MNRNRLQIGGVMAIDESVITMVTESAIALWATAGLLNYLTGPAFRNLKFRLQQVTA